MSFFIKLLETTDAERVELEGLQKIQDMLGGKMTRDEYVVFLLELYHIVWHFVPIMSAAASRCPDEFRQVRFHLYHEIEEEKGHELMVLEDLKTFGVEADVARSNRPSYPIQAMLGYNYYTCERLHPCGVVGMLYALEFISSVYSGQLATAISLGLKLPLPQGFTFLDSHSAMDLDHVAELRELLQTIDDPAAQDVIMNSIQVNFYLFKKFMEFIT